MMVTMPCSPVAASATLDTLRHRLVLFARAIVRDAELAEDVVQEVALRLVDDAQLARFNDEQHVEAWLWRTTRHRAIDCCRRRRARREVPSEAALVALEQACQRREAEPPTEALQACLSGLSDYARSLVELRYRRGLDGDGIASALGRKAGAIYTALSRVHAQLRDCIRRRLAEEER